MTIPRVLSLTIIYLIYPCHLDFSKSSHYFWVCAPSYLRPWNSLSNWLLLGVIAEAPNILCSWRCPSRTLDLVSFKSTLASTRVKHNTYEVEGNEGGDSLSELETEWDTLPPALIVPDLDWQYEQSLGIAVFLVSLSLADGIVVHFSWVAMFLALISVEGCSWVPSEQKFWNKILVPRIDY